MEGVERKWNEFKDMWFKTSVRWREPINKTGENFYAFVKVWEMSENKPEPIELRTVIEGPDDAVVPGWYVCPQHKYPVKLMRRNINHTCDGCQDYVGGDEMVRDATHDFDMCGKCFRKHCNPLVKSTAVTVKEPVVSPALRVCLAACERVLPVAMHAEPTHEMMSMYF